MTAKRPKVFISSTVYDFRDLRSSLKYSLEELGYEVLLSENNDFPVQVDVNSYESCLRAIDDCDYFILLIGSRVGGWYDATNRISITQTEYRRAYDRLVRGQIKLVTFVREDVWTVKEDRNALERLLKGEALKDAELEEPQISQIVKHSSKFTNDAEFTFQFLKEVARIEEMRIATAGEGKYPAGNWIRPFSSYRDIVDSLRIEFRMGTDLRRIALLANLKNEIETNLCILTNQNTENNSLCPKYTWAGQAKSEFGGSLHGNSEIRGKYLRWFGLFALIGCGLGRKLSTSALDEAVISGELLDFDRVSDSYVVGPMQQALIDLKRNIERLRHNDELLDTARRINLMQQFSHCDGEETVVVNNVDIIPLISIHDSQSNVVTLSKAVHLAACGDSDALKDIKLYGNSPIDEENEQMSRERPSLKQVREWLNQNE